VPPIAAFIISADDPASPIFGIAATVSPSEVTPLVDESIKEACFFRMAVSFFCDKDKGKDCEVGAGELEDADEVAAVTLLVTGLASRSFSSLSSAADNGATRTP
jgi:hypothetical protein